LYESRIHPRSNEGKTGGQEMSKRKTISTRYTDFTREEPFWSKVILVVLSLSLLGLWVHLWILSGLLRTVGLVAMIAFVTIAEGLLAWKRQWWWFYFWLCIIALVGGFEIASYFFGS
jgi:hypothetical protein